MFKKKVPPTPTEPPVEYKIHVKFGTMGPHKNDWFFRIDRVDGDKLVPIKLPLTHYRSLKYVSSVRDQTWCIAIGGGFRLFGGDTGGDYHSTVKIAEDLLYKLKNEVIEANVNYKPTSTYLSPPPVG